MTGLTMLDSAYNDQFPPGAAAYAGYVDGGIGNQPNYAWIVSAFPQAHHLSIALFARDDADALDVESGAAQPSDIPGWHARQAARGITRPVIYANAYTMDAEVLPVLSAAGITRPSVRLWSAHYDGEHVCGPRPSCGALSVNADGTQWTQNALGRTLDQSLLLDDFFGTPAPASWEDQLVASIPVIAKNSTDAQAVKNWQGLLVARGYNLGVTGARKDGVDGVFGSTTDAATRDFQKAKGIGVDGTVGPATYGAALSA
jgi:peptidoglycan hydrolase-like protein with peptidoglycan-binding domain